MKNLFLYVLLAASLSCCKKEEVTKPQTVNEAGYQNEIDIYRPGTYWVYTWQEFDMAGLQTSTGTDTITVTGDTQFANKRTLTGAVNGVNYTSEYLITNDSVVYAGKSGNYPLYYLTRVFIDSTQIITDHLLSGPERGCSISLHYYNQPNVTLQTATGTFSTVEAKQITLISNDNGGCDNGYETVNYVPRLGEIYRETSWVNSSNSNFKIRYMRKLKEWHIAN